MHSIFEVRNAISRPRGVTWMGWTSFMVSALIVIFGCLVAASRISFTRAGWLIGMDAAQMGPALFAIGAAAYAACGWGLLTMRRWGRWLAIVLLIVGLIEQVPSVSAAVAEFHFAALAREAVAFFVRMICLRYLFQEDVREAFE